MDNNEINENETKQNKEKFEEIYRTKIEPNLKKLEVHRIKQKKEYDIFLVIMIVSFILLAILTILLSTVCKEQDAYNSHLIFGIILFLITTTISLYRVVDISNNFRKKIKPILLAPILSVFGAIRWTEKELMSLKEIKKLKLFNKASNKKDDDNITGMYKGCPITIVETTLSHCSSDRNVCDLEGLILKIKMDKKFSGIIVGEGKINFENYINLVKKVSMQHPELFPQKDIKWLDSPIIRTIGNLATNDTNSILNINVIDFFNKKYKKIQMHDPVINKNFTIYSDNQLEAMSILSPSFIEKIKNLQNIFLVTTVSFIFKEEFLYLFLDNSYLANELVNRKVNSNTENGFFEVGNINNTLINKNQYLRIFKELTAIFSLIDYFKDNEEEML